VAAEELDLRAYLARLARQRESLALRELCGRQARLAKLQEDLVLRELCGLQAPQVASDLAAVAERQDDAMLQELYQWQAECAGAAAAQLGHGLLVPELWWPPAELAGAATAKPGEGLLLHHLGVPLCADGHTGVGVGNAPEVWAAPASLCSWGAAPRSPRVQQPAQASSLQAVMQEIAEVDAGSVILVRKIKKMGFSSRRLLRDHFSQFGMVAKVLMAHSRLKGSEQPRLRPASLGFVVMRSSAEAEHAFAAGSTQEVSGVSIDVLRFVRRGGGVPEGPDRGQGLDELPEDALPEEAVEAASEGP